MGEMLVLGLIEGLSEDLRRLVEIILMTLLL